MEVQRYVTCLKSHAYSTRLTRNLRAVIPPYSIFITPTGPRTMARTQWALSKYLLNEQLNKEYVCKALTPVNINSTLVFWKSMFEFITSSLK